MKIQLISALLWMALPVLAQVPDNPRQSLLEEIEKNNTQLIALRAQMEVEVAQNRVGNALADPKVGFSYAWGNREGMPDKKAVSVEQDLDWATLTGQRRTATRLKNERAHFTYRLQRQQLLAQADQLLIGLTYDNALCQEMQGRMERAQRLKDLYELKFANGEANQIELNKVKLNYTAAVADYRRATAQQQKTRDELKKMNGNRALTFAQHEFAAVTLPAYATLEEEALARAPQIQQAQRAVAEQTKELKIARSEGMPTLSVGYSGEFVGGENYNGLNVGVSIPLWGNSRRKVKMQKASVVASQLDQQDATLQVRATLSQQYEQALQLLQVAAQFKAEITENEDIALLDKALAAGQLSLIDYLNELNFYNEAHEQALETDRDSQLAVSELLSIFR